MEVPKFCISNKFPSDSDADVDSHKCHLRTPVLVYVPKSSCNEMNCLKVILVHQRLSIELNLCHPCSPTAPQETHEATVDSEKS